MRSMELGLTGELSRAKGAAPLHQQVASRIRDAIATGGLEPGAVLPGEDTLAELMGVSRIVTRQALTRLADEGVVTRRHGQPTTVAEPVPTRYMNTARYAEELALLRSGKPHPMTSAFTREFNVRWRDCTVDAHYETRPANDFEQDHLKLATGTDVLERQLTKFIKGHPVQLQKSWIPLDLVRDTAVMDPERQPWPGGTLAELHAVGITVEHVVEEAWARIPDPDVRGRLQLRPSQPVLEVLRVFSAEGRPVEFSITQLPALGVRLRYETDLRRQ